MDPFNAPSWGSAPNYQANLEKDVAQSAPLARNYNGAQTGVNIHQVFNKVSTPQPSNIDKFGHFIGGVAHSIGHVSTSVASWLATQTKHMATAIPREAKGFRNAILDNYDINSNQARATQNNDRLLALHAQYKAGKITSKDYQTGLKLLIQDNNQLTEDQLGLQKKIQADKIDAYQATIDTAAVLVTILTAGFGPATSVNIGADGLVQSGEMKASDWLASKAAAAYLKPIENSISRVASQPEVFNAFTDAGKLALQKSTAEVIASNTGRMTAQQIARASAANLALKYPIYYNMLSTTSQQIYKELDNKQYGDAVRTLAFNAALLLSGGPIGKALGVGGKAIGFGAGKVFGKTSFIDELSKGIGDGNPSGLYRAIDNIKDPVAKEEAIRGLSAVEATNLEATSGKDAVAAAWRVLNGMSSYEGVSMSQFTHEEALTNMVNFAKAQQLVDEVGKANGLGPITVGRVDARTLNKISSELAPFSSVEDRLNIWDAMKGENPNAAWAHNDNFDRQIKSLIKKHEDATSLDSAIRGIKASFTVEGFPAKEAAQLSKMGYIPIKPVNLEAPFKEGTGKLSSKFAQNDDFFTRTVQPVPILSSVGSFLTHMGLSPTASTSRVYQLFNANLAENITKLDLVHTTSEKGLNIAETADNIIKKLSNYAHDPTRGVKIDGRPFRPITDLRQLTTKDIQAALETSRADAKEVKAALTDAMVKVPLQVRGLGDKLVDVNYRINPLAGQYARLQGALRFSWNPFFQAKLAYKTELLAQAEVNGKFPTMGGTNTILATIFPDKYAKIDEVRGLLRDNGIFSEKAKFGTSVSGEAVNDVGIASANLTHNLIPSQERSIASMVQVQADKVGMSTEDFIKNFPNEVRDTVQMIAQYDRNSVFLNSAMARTLNLAFFPFRFEYKVASIMARSLARTDPMTQLAVINGLYRTNDWLNSPEGQVWYSENSEVIGIIKYFTPIQTLAEVSNLLGGHPDSVGSFGELGGLPFGWIPQALDAAGLTHFGGAYVNPKTGQQVPDYVPITDRGKLASALQDFIGSIYSYPGATLGLPITKGDLNRFAALGVTGATKQADFSKVYPEMNAREQGFSDTLQQHANQTIRSQGGIVPQNNVQTPPPNPNLSPTTPVTPQDSSLLHPAPKPTKSGSSSSKKKKSQYTPQLLPGQSTLGQL